MKNAFKYWAAVLSGILLLLTVVSCKKNKPPLDPRTFAGQYACQKYYWANRDSMLADGSAIEVSRTDSMVGLDTLQVAISGDTMFTGGFTLIQAQARVDSREYYGAGVYRPIAVVYLADSIDLFETDTALGSATIQAGYRYHGHKTR